MVFIRCEDFPPFPAKILAILSQRILRNTPLATQYTKRFAEDDAVMRTRDMERATWKVVNERMRVGLHTFAAFISGS